MNVILNFSNLNYKIEITKTTPLSFLYKLSEKQFNVSQEKINLIYNEKIIPNTSNPAGEYFQNKSMFPGHLPDRIPYDYIHQDW